MTKTPCSRSAADQPNTASQSQAIPHSTVKAYAAHCPACRGKDVAVILEVTASQAAQHFIIPREDPVRNKRLKENIHSLWAGDTCQLLKCRTCEFGFSWPFVAGDSTFYNLAYRDAHYPRMKWEYQRTLKALSGQILQDCSAIEVGAGNGFFLDLLTKDTLPKNAITAIEFSDNARKELVKKGYSTTPADLRSSDFDNCSEAFNFIFMFQVLEHMDNLDALFQRLNRLLRPGGSVFIAVPNQVRTNYHESADSLLDMPPNHVSRWTTGAFHSIAARAGMAVVASEVEPFNVKNFILEDVSYSHIQRAQNPRSLAGGIRSLPRGKMRFYTEAALAGLWIPARLPKWARAFHNRKQMGGCLWVQLKSA